MMKSTCPTIFAATLLLVCSKALLAQNRITTWTSVKDQESYLEGSYSLKVSSPPLELVSLYKYIEPIAFDKRQQLKVRFVSNSAQYYFFSIREKKVHRFYALESKPGTIS